MSADSQVRSSPAGRAEIPDQLVVLGDQRPGHRAIFMDALQMLRDSMLRWLTRGGVLRDEAEDAIQEAFVRLWLTDRVEHIRNPAAFVTGVVKRLRIDLWRRARRQQRRFVAECTDEFDVADSGPQPSDYVQADQRLERMWCLLGELSPRTREIFFQHRLEGWTSAQIATALGISVSAVEKHIARAAFALADEWNAE